MSGKLRFASVVLIATLMVVAGCSIVAFRANAQTQTLYTVLLRARHANGACVDIGTIVVDQKPYTLPATAALPAGTHQVQFSVSSGCEFVTWEAEGGVSLQFTAMGASAAVSNGPGPTTMIYVEGAGTLRVVYKGTGCCGVGGVALPTNTLAVFAPYLAVIGLVAVGATVVVKKRRN